jgi:hypothetical protein
MAPHPVRWSPECPRCDPPGVEGPLGRRDFDPAHRDSESRMERERHEYTADAHMEHRVAG